MAILRKQEFDAFLVTAFSSELTNAHYLQELQVNNLLVQVKLSFEITGIVLTGAWYKVLTKHRFKSF